MADSGMFNDAWKRSIGLGMSLQEILKDVKGDEEQAQYIEEAFEHVTKAAKNIHLAYACSAEQGSE